VDEGGIDASAKDGVLTLRLPKLKAAEVEKRQIEIRKG
jgi:HSP20 family molecular chaperone IbpA